MNAKAAGKAAIHCAAVAGNVAVLKVIMEFNPDLEIEVSDAVYASSQLQTLLLRWLSKIILVGFF